MKRDILSRRIGECLYCLTPDSPFIFCGEPVFAEGKSYCAEHHAMCHAGFGKDVGSLEAMIYSMDGSVNRLRRHAQIAGATNYIHHQNDAKESPVTVPVDVHIRGRA